jgi:hypothetical protein
MSFAPHTQMADGADAAAAAPAVDPLAPPKAVAAPKLEYTTYSDDTSFGKPAPSLDTLEYFQVRSASVYTGMCVRAWVIARVRVHELTCTT